MNFDQLLAHIKGEGCRIRVWHKRQYIDGSVGTFDITEAGPIINIAARGESKKRTMNTLLHEYGHYIQWKDGFISCIEAVCPTHELYYHWLKGNRDLSQIELTSARNAMLWIEWDAEMRGYKLGTKLKINGFDPDYYLKGAMAYMISIKWSWANRSDWKICASPYDIKRAKIYSIDELFAPLTRTEKALTKCIRC